MKIAIVSSGFLPVIDGVTVSGYCRLQQLSKLGHEVILFCPDYSALAAVYPNWQDYTGQILPGVRIVNLASDPFMGLDFERNVARRSYPEMLQELETFQPDIIHVDEPERLFMGFWRIAGLKFAKKAGIPCVSFFRTNFLEYLEDYFLIPGIKLSTLEFIIKPAIVHIYNAYDATLATSTITHKKLISLGIKNTIHKNLVGFDAAQFFSQDSSQNHELQENFFAHKYGLTKVDKLIKLIFLGRLTPDKGWEFTLDTFAKITTEINLDNVALIIAGDGSMVKEIRARLSKITPHFHLLGRISPEDVPALLANCDIHITTSEKENRGLTILEAFAVGIPVLAPCAGGVVENILDGENGFLFNPGDQDDFISKLKLLVENPSLRKSMGKKGQETIAQYKWEQAVANLISIWEEQIAKKKNSKRE